MNNMRNKILMTLALLLTAVTGAWADETPLVTINASNDFKSGSKTFDNKVTATFSSDVAFSTNVRNGGWFSFSGERTLTVEPADGVTITRVKYYTTLGDAEVITAPFVASMSLKYVYVSGGSQQYCHVSVKDIMIGAEGTNNYLQKIEVFGTAEPPLAVEWNVATKTGTFTMPAYDVEIAPIYAPAAKWATDGDKVLAPTAVEGVIAGTEDAIVKAGTVVEGQGTVKYFATTDAEMTAEKAAAAEGWLATVPTAEGYDGAQTVYVWYYIKGADTPQGEKATAENTFNDSEICATPLTVTVLSNKFDIQFNAANANTIEAGKATVKVGDAAAEVKEGKLTGVKMGSKVTVTAKEGYKFRKVEGKKKTSIVPVTAITLNKTETSIKVGATETLSVTSVLPEEATDKTYTWKTSDETKATVDQDGKVTAVAEGTVTIYAEANDGSGVKGNCTVTVTPAPVPVTVTWNNNDITGTGNSFTKGGVTLTAGQIDYKDKDISLDGTFTTTLGNFTKIEVTTAWFSASGTGWSSGTGITPKTGTWTGNASSVSFSGNIWGQGEGNTKFVFTIEPKN